MTTKPTGKQGRGIPARDFCCACQNSGWFRFRDGHTVPCTNCPHGWRVDATHAQFTQPGGHSAKTARRVGAPNNHQGSGENPMVGNPVARHRVVFRVRELMATQAHRWLLLDQHGLVVDLSGLADLVAEIAEGHAEVVRAQRAALWQMLKTQARAVIQLRGEHAELTDTVWSLSSEVSSLQGEATRLLLDLNQWRTDHTRLRAERDEIARESEVREQEIVALTVERDRVAARLSELDSTSGEVDR